MIRQVYRRYIINIISIGAAIKHSSPVIIHLNGSLVGNPNFAQYASNSCYWVDTSVPNVEIYKGQIHINKRIKWDYSEDE